MFAFRRSNVTVTAATALVALSLSLPASAEQSSPAPASEALQATVTDAPTPRLRPAVRKRVGKSVSVRLYVQPARPYWLVRPPVQRVVYRPPVERVVAAHWPMLFVGVAY